MKLFKSSHHAIRFVFASGKDINFVGGLYATDEEDEIKELTSTAKLGGMIYIDPEQKEISAEEFANPAVAYEKKILEKHGVNTTTEDTPNAAAKLGAASTANLAELLKTI